MMDYLPQPNEQNLCSVISSLLSNLAVQHTKHFLQKSIAKTSITVNSIRHLLRQYQIAVLPVELAAPQLTEIPLPALVQYKNGAFAVLMACEADQVTLFDPQRKSFSSSVASFHQLWSGITLLIEKTDTSSEPNYKANKKQETIENLRLPLLLLACLLVVGYAAFQLPNLESLAWLGTKLVGTVLSVLLLWQSLNKNSAVARLCSFHKKTDCNSLLTSPAATLFGVISWAEIGFFYFAGALLALLLGLDNLLIFKLLAYLSLPFVAWSIWYQWQIAKVWCPLCLGVATILLIEITLSLSPLIGVPNHPEGGIDVISSNSPFGGWGAVVLPFFYFFLKPFFTSSLQVPVLQKQVAQFKYNFDIFTHLLHQQRQINTNEVPQQIVWGNVDSPVQLVFVTNPDCKPCQAAKPKIETLLQQFSEELQVVVVYTKFDEKTLHEKTSHEKTLQGLKPAMELLVRFNEESHKNWCNANQITHTPTFFLQGYELPEGYQVEDLQYFIAEMAEEVVV